MDINVLKNNATALTVQLQWLAAVIDVRMKHYFGQPCEFENIAAIPLPDVGEKLAFESIVQHYQMSIPERVALLMALVPHLQPQLFDVFFMRNANYDKGFTEFGGLKGKNNAGFIPTGETVAFVLAGSDLFARLQLQELFSAEHFFSKFNILKLADVDAGEPLLNGVLQLSDEYLSLLTTGADIKPLYSSSFPAKLITTNLNWDDLVLDKQTLNEVIEIQTWISHSQTLMVDWGLDKKIKPGYRSLFYGPPGTGKTLTTALLGKATGMDIYRIDLSMVVSKYIGETEKNLANIFDQAENKNWILFFDDADAIFGRPTEIGDAQNSHANAEVAYLKQRISDFSGVIIFASNIKANAGSGFINLFQSAIHFDMPGAGERLKLWQQAFSGNIPVEQTLMDKLADIAANYEIAGGGITNVLRYAALKAIKNEKQEITYNDIIAGIKRELLK